MATTNADVSIALAHLLRGPLHAEDQAAVWSTVLGSTAQLRDHLSVLGLRLIIDDTERYAYLRTEDDLPEAMPRLVRRHSLTFGASVLLVLLRQQLTTAETDGQAPRLVVTGEEMVEMLRLYHRESITRERINGDVTALDKLGYLRKLRGSDDSWEVRRIIKAMVTAGWINTFGQHLLNANAANETLDASSSSSSEDAAEDDPAGPAAAAAQDDPSVTPVTDLTDRKPLVPEDSETKDLPAQSELLSLADDEGEA